MTLAVLGDGVLKKNDGLHIVFDERGDQVCLHVDDVKAVSEDEEDVVARVAEMHPGDGGEVVVESTLSLLDEHDLFSFFAGLFNHVDAHIIVHKSLAPGGALESVSPPPVGFGDLLHADSLTGRGVQANLGVGNSKLQVEVVTGFVPVHGADSLLPGLG